MTTTTKPPWKTLKTGQSEGGATIELRYAAFGKGRGKCHYWRIYRDGAYVGYGAIASDAEENFQRALADLVRDSHTGRWVPANTVG